MFLLLTKKTSASKSSNYFTRITAFVAFYCFLGIGVLKAQQCQVRPSSCLPGAAPLSSFVFGMGIYNVNIGSINNTTLGVQDGYKDYSCSHMAMLTIGHDYNITIRTGAPAQEQVKVWIDLNNDGVFGSSSELVFSSTAITTHAGTIRLPVGSVLNMSLRMRVAADYANSPQPTPCSTPQYSQTEDYSVILLPSIARPQVFFNAADTITCNGPVQFRDASLNAPIAWLWDFGDQTSSTQQNPYHIYSQPGVYNVKLKACNSYGCDSLLRVAYIRYRPSSLTPRAVCQISTANYCCGYGITGFQLGGLTNMSQDASVGYEDFTCSRQIQLQRGNRYPITVHTGGSNAHDVRVYLDMNDDGSFNPTSELLFQATNQRSPSGECIIPILATLNRPLRLRVVAEPTGSAAVVCGGLSAGQAEDYTVTVVPNVNKPSVRFVSTYASACDSAIQFTDQTAALPTSWHWNFGDGTFSTAQNPAHTYARPGTYRVQLRACNANGCDSLPNPLQLLVLGRGPQASCIPQIAYPQQPATERFGIQRVLLQGIDNSSADARAGYENFACDRRATLMAGGSYRLVIIPYNATELGFGQGANSYARVWIDFNGDNQLSAAELVYDNNAVPVHLVTVQVPTTARTNVPLRLRVFNSYFLEAPPVCGPTQYGQAEDYTVVIKPATGLYEPWFYPHQDTVRAGTAVTFFETTNVALWQGVTWQWDFGDGTSASPAPFPSTRHTYTQPGRYSVSLTACNAAGCRTVQRAGVVTVLPGPAPRASLCWSTGFTRWAGRYGIARIQMDTLSVMNQDVLTTYRDMTTLSSIPVVAGNRVTLTANGFVPQENRPRHWLAVCDFNNDGQFSAGELLGRSQSSGFSTSFLVPTTAVRNMPLRLRLVSDSILVNMPACGSYSGQAIDVALQVQAPLPARNSKGAIAVGVFPNPVTDRMQVTFELAQPQTVSIDLKSVHGKTVVKLLTGQRLQAGYHQALLNIKDNAIAAGMYLLHVTTNEGVLTKRIIIN